MNTSNRWDEGITGPTLQIAANQHSPLRVLAGPGTGKTFALMRRVLRLLQNGDRPDCILVSTFTRTAAKDLTTALEELGTDVVENVKADTLHSLCFSILSRNEVLQLTGRHPRPLMDFETRFLLQDLCGGVLGGIRDCKKRLHLFSAAWSRLQSEEPGWLKTDVDRLFDSELNRWLVFHEAMLIGELIPITLRYLRDNPTCPERSTFEHVLVDEYQDLNRAEQVLLDYLASGGTLTVIGDENQSIYSFKYAHPEGIVEFAKYHEGTADETLQACRRCPKRVVSMANDLIRHSSHRPVRQLEPFATNPDGEVHVVQWTSIQSEADGIAAFVKSRIQSGTVAPGRVLVLSPRRQFGYAIRDALKKANVDAHSFFNEEELEGNPTIAADCTAQERFVLLCLLANPDDRVALRCWCGFGQASLQQAGWKRVFDHCANSGQAPRATLEELASAKLKLPYTSGVVERYKLLSEQIARLHGLSGQALVDALFPKEDSWTEPFRSIGKTIEESDFEADHLLKALRGAIIQPELPTDVDYVRIMSLHKSKGLTAELVVVAGCIEGLIPFIDFKQPQEERERQLEEQRRLFYVAITRTRQTLVLSSVRTLPVDLALRMGASTRRTTNPLIGQTIASRFFGQLGPACPAAITGEQFIHKCILT